MTLTRQKEWTDTVCLGHRQDPSFNLDTSVKSDEDFVTCGATRDFVTCGATRAAELAGIMVGRSDRVVREWRSQFFSNGGQRVSRASMSDLVWFGVTRILIRRLVDTHVHQQMCLFS